MSLSLTEPRTLTVYGVSCSSPSSSLVEAAVSLVSNGWAWVSRADVSAALNTVKNSRSGRG